VDSLLTKLKPQKISTSASGKIVNALLLSKNRHWYNSYWIGIAALLLLASILVYGMIKSIGTTPADISFDQTVERARQVSNQLQGLPGQFIQQVKQIDFLENLSILFKPDAIKVFFALLVLGFYGLVDQFIRGRFFH
jgi:hypothetical protein